MRQLALAALVLLAGCDLFGSDDPDPTPDAGVPAADAGHDRLDPVPARSTAYRPTALTPDVPADVQGVGIARTGTIAGQVDQREESFVFDAFNYFAWESFVALGWPATSALDGTPDRSKTIGDPQYRGAAVWETYMNAQNLFPRDGSAPPAWGPQDLDTPGRLPAACERLLAEPATQATLQNAGWVKLVARGRKVASDGLVNEIAQAGAPMGEGLVDQNGNQVRYEIAVNRAEYEYIAAGLYERDAYCSAKKAGGIDLPDGSMEIKAAWKVLAADDCTAPAGSERYHTRCSVVYTQPVLHKDGTVLYPETCDVALLGLIGMHLVQRVASTPQSTWATFEHVDNVPASMAEQVMPTGNGSYSLFKDDPACVDLSAAGCSPNVYPPADLVDIGDGKRAPRPCPLIDPSQAGTSTSACEPVQVWRDHNGFRLLGFREVNDTMHGLLRAAHTNSVWQNYVLVGTQWATQPFTAELDVVGPGSGPYQFDMGTSTYRMKTDDIPAFVPPHLVNTTMETYMQQVAGPNPPPAPQPGDVNQYPTNNGDLFPRVGGCMECHQYGDDWSFIWAAGFGDQALQSGQPVAACP